MNRLKQFWDKFKDFKKRFFNDHDLIGLKFFITLVLVVIVLIIDGR